MFINKKYPSTLSSLYKENTVDIITEEFETETGTLEVTGTGEIRITNTGGSSASEGGMGSDSDDDKAKGDLTKPGEDKSGNSKSSDDSDTAFDPIKKNVREKEKAAAKDWILY